MKPTTLIFILGLALTPSTLALFGPGTVDLSGGLAEGWQYYDGTIADTLESCPYYGLNIGKDTVKKTFSNWIGGSTGKISMQLTFIDQFGSDSSVQVFVNDVLITTAYADVWASGGDVCGSIFDDITYTVSGDFDVTVGGDVTVMIVPAIDSVTEGVIVYRVEFSEPSSSIGGGAVAGIVIGVLIFVGILAACGYFGKKKRDQMRQNRPTVQNTTTIHHEVKQQEIYQQPQYQTQPVYQQPVYQQPVVQQPIYQQQPVYDQTYQQPMYQQPMYQQQQPMYQQPGCDQFGQQQQFGGQQQQFGYYDPNQQGMNPMYQQQYMQPVQQPQPQQIVIKMNQ